MTGQALMEYVKNPGRIQIIQKSETIDVPVRKRSSFIEKTVDSSYAMAVKHAYNRLDINFLAGVDNETTLKEFKDWALEHGVDVDKQYSDEEGV
jgi:hypothetical protein